MKFLGITVDKHLTFNSHVDTLVKRAFSRIHGLVVFKRSGLNQAGLLKMYVTNIRSLVTYAVPAWFPLLSKFNMDKLESVQKLALKIIFPELSSYNDRMEIAGLHQLCDYCSVVCKKYVNKIENDSSHILHSRMPHKQSSHGRHSCRIKDKYVKMCRTKTRENAVLMKYAN
eukprot:GHVU01089247.1.p1 GENE.GHVU01089247.1~~GHVU01089247.1.p1  ORF type:complete len:171 (-),score=1.76 GHVU01089247.1:397-909(-)